MLRCVSLRDIVDHIDMIKLGGKWSRLGIAFRFQSSYNFLIKQMSKYVDNSEYINYDGIRTYVRIVNYKWGIKIMTENEKELIKLIRENDNPTTALMTAAVIVLGYLKQHESSPKQSVAYLSELC